jgi:uncharacterized repeat protein (TIGR01451 family)
VGSSDITFSRNIVRDNTADENGGGLFVFYSNATFHDNFISENTASGTNVGGNGGGMYLCESDDATLTSNVVSGNTAMGEYGGGGLFLCSNPATLVNNLVAHNRAQASGSGIYISVDGLHVSPRLFHTTIVSNTGGDGSGIHVSNPYDPYAHRPSGIVTMTNTILVGHRVGISVTANQRAELIATLWGAGDWANDVDWGGAGTVVTGTINVWGDPAFLDPGAGDYHIGLTSAAIDRAVVVGAVDDMDGEARPQGIGYDIGADEVGPWVTKQAFPNPVQPGGQLTFTIYITNVSNVTMHAAITDTLPPHVTLDGTSGETLILPGGATGITWTVTLAPTSVWVGTVVVTVEDGYEGGLTNQVEVTTQEGVAGAAFVIANPCQIYLPLILRPWTPSRVPRLSMHDALPKARYA